MHLLRLYCQTCGDIEVLNINIELRICLDNEVADYNFRCPKCEMTDSIIIDQGFKGFLFNNEVHVTAWRLPAELQERPVGLAAITHDDLIDWHEQLNQTDYLAHWASTD